jgi:hypothetical protein
MQIRITRETIFGSVSAALVLLAVFARNVPGRAWLGLAGFTALAATLLLDRRQPRRLRQVLLAVYFVISGAHFGGETVWGRHFSFLDDVLLVAMCVVVPLMLWALVSERAEPSRVVE